MQDSWTTTELAQTLDAAILKPDLTTAEALDAMDALVRAKVKTVCVRSCDVPLASARVANSETGVSCVVGFPHGCCPTETKLQEAQWVIKHGANEIDMVVNYGWVRSERWEEVRQEIQTIVECCHQHEILLKVIFETSVLTQDQILRLVDVCLEAGADFVKTSTGFNGAGAQPDTVQAMIDRVAGRCEVKPSGGIRDRATAERYLKMGATRLGVNYSSVPAILEFGASTSTEGY